MKNTRWSRLTAWLVMLVMALTFSALTAVVVAEGSDEGGTPSGQAGEKKILPSETIVSSITLETPPEAVENVTGNAVFTFIGGDGKAVNSPADMDPNQSNTLRIDLSGLSTEKDVTKTPVLAVTLPEYIKVPQTALDTISGDVTGKLGDNGQLELRWTGDRQEQVTLDLPVIPNVPAANDLSGTYMLAAANGSMLGALPYEGNKLTASWVRQRGSMYYTETEEEPFWTLTHVSGDYYTVRSTGTDKYLKIEESDKGLYLVTADQETAQKIKLVDRGNGKYSFVYKKLSINNYGNNAMNGFGAYDIQTGDNALLKMYASSLLSKDPAAKDMSGTWYIVINSRILGSDARESGRLNSAYWNKYDSILIPKDNITMWTFDHIIHDWYTVKCDAGYLNITEDGVFVTNNPQHLIIKYNGDHSQVALSNGEFDKKSFMLKMLDGNSINGFGSAPNGMGGNANITLMSGDAFAYEQTQISGSWAIGNESTGGVILNEMSGTRLASDSFFRTGAWSVTVPGKEVEVWTFTQDEGNWYTIQNQAGQYLKLTTSNGTVELSSSKARVYIQSYNGKYRFINEKGFALNNYDQKSTGGFTSYNSGDNGKSQNEWHSLYSVSATAADILIFSANGGSSAETPEAIVADPGTVITLPNYTGSKGSERFIGWAETKEFYKNQGKSHNYHELYKPGTSYTVKGGTTTLYAVWDNKVKTVQFFIRRDGIIHDEPSNYDTSKYTGELKIENALDEGRWIIDLDGRNPIKDYYVNNSIMANLKIIPTQDQIETWLKQQNEPFDPETMYIHFYVLKSTNEGGQWHVDGVIRTKTKVGLSYNTNVPAAEKLDVKNMPGGVQVEPGTELLVGADKNGSEIKTPVREGYVFKGWNTAADGSGTDYTEGHYVVLTNNLNLYAQWVEASEGKLVVMVESEWPAGKPAYAGTEITLKAVLTGFENKDYTLYWQYSPDNRETWVDIPGANGMTYTYEMSDSVADYIWRVVARDVRNKE